jgi:hypothetical protein
MINKYNKQFYANSLHLLNVSPNLFSALNACVEDCLKGFEASSRSISMVCHSFKMGTSMKVGSKIENAARLSDEINPSVAGYYYKVGELVISFDNTAGERVSVRHRPDSLRLLQLPDADKSKVFKPSDYIRFAEYKSF